MPKTYEELLGLAKKEPIVKVALERLSPPPVVKSDMELDFYAIANSSDFQRFVVFLAKKITPGLFNGVSTRVTGSKMKQQFNDTRADYRLVMTELKEKLKERSENNE